MFRTFIYVSLIFVCLGCTKSTELYQKPSLSSVLGDPKTTWNEKKAYLLARMLSDPAWEKRWWVEKTVRLLRAGDPLTINEDLEALAAKSEDEVIDMLMQDDRFGDTLLDFNMYFLGFKEDRVRGHDGYVPTTFGYPNAITSAQNAVRGGDYFSLFDFYSDSYTMPPLMKPFLKVGDDPTLPDDIRRRSRIAEGQAKIKQRIDEIRANPSMKSQDLCTTLSMDLNEFSSGLGLPFTLQFWAMNLNPQSYLPIQMACFQNFPPATDFIPLLEAAYATNERFFAEILKYEPTLYKPKTLTEIQRLDMAAAGIPGRWLNFSLDQVTSLTNSSTNYNRKRANYILKQYFCDDMTPIAVESPANHAGGGPHASETSCRSCHYKLDPMAGFFRNYGIIFLDFNNFGTIVFDDTATMDRAKYEEAWKTPAGSPRAWDIGYIRSVTSPADNEYGESLQDLSDIIRRSPEPKRCIVKRMFEYFVAPDQMIDAGYMSHLTDQMILEAKTDSAQAIKNTIRRLLKSESFKKTDMDPSQCYDFPPGGVQGDAPPCRVAYILQKNCVQCHDSTGAKGGLDLSRWLILPDGSKNFPHVDSSGQQRSAKVTIDEILKRLASPDPDERMPYKKMMTSQERQELYLWAQGLPIGP